MLNRHPASGKIGPMYESYKERFLGLTPVAIKLHQKEINAAHHYTWGIVTCDQCKMEFAIGEYQVYPQSSRPEMECVQKLERFLAEDHKSAREHENVYDLGWKPSIF